MELAENNAEQSVEILIVEDSLTQAIRLQYILEDNGFHVVMAHNGLEALEALSKHKPTLIISDIVMPEMDGYELCRQVKTNENLMDIPIILLTTLSDLQDVVRALESGADNFVTKPYTAEFLLSRIQHILINQEIRKSSKISTGVEIFFANKKYFFSSEPTQMVDLLLSTFENAVQKNLELEKVNRQLLSMQRELAHKNRELKKLNDQKDQFLGIAAHDLRNPLGNISMTSEVLVGGTEGQLDEEMRELLSVIQSSSNFMLALVNDLLDISAIESGKLNLNLETIDLVPLVQHNVSLNKSLAEQKQIRLVFRRDDDAAYKMRVDPAKIEQVLNNLITNAIKFSYPESVIEVAMQTKGPDVLILVKDTGQGIPTHEIDNIFEPFKRTSVKSTAGEKSTGLGLAIVRKIVAGHQGEIRVDSEVGQGTTFSFTLPLGAEE